MDFLAGVLGATFLAGVAFLVVVLAGAFFVVFAMIHFLSVKNKHYA